MRVLAMAIAIGVLTSDPAAAHGAQRPQFQPHRFDEDWRPLCDPALQTAPLDRLKCLPVAPETTLTLGGELRERIELARNPRFGLTQDRESAALHRALLHADLRVGSNVRVFTQIGFFDQSGRDSGAAPTDIDRLDVTQAFLDLSLPVAGGVATLRGGRQELSFGSSRLVSTRDGPNIRRSFDGARSLWVGGGYRTDAFYLRPVAINPGIFDDGTDQGEAFWGVHATGPVLGSPVLEADIYYLGYQRADTSFATGVADERRHTLGVRLFGETKSFDWDIEAAYQFGSFGERDIGAWTVASDVGYTMAGIPLRPRFGMKLDIASGDRSPTDGILGTFNALYPKLPYFSEANLIAPANIIDVHPSLALDLGSGVRVDLGWNVLWRQTAQDAIYGTPLKAIPRTAGQSGRFIGHQAIVGMEWQATYNVTLSGQYVRFWNGHTLRRVGGRDVDFLAVAVSYKW